MKTVGSRQLAIGRVKALVAFFAFVALGCAPRQADAQFLGYAAQQTITKAFDITAGAPTPQTAVTLPNYGQVGHTLIVTYGGLGADCSTYLQASFDGSNWTTIASAPQTNTSFNIKFAYATGYFPYLRVFANALNDAGCTVEISGSYIGYQIPVTFTGQMYNVPVPNVTSAALLSTSAPRFSPVNVIGFSCTNLTGVNAFLQLSDWTGGVALGAGVLYQIPIANGASIVETTPIFFGNMPAAGASTTLSGAVAVGNGLTCNFRLNVTGPFWPVTGVPNRL